MKFAFTFSTVGNSANNGIVKMVSKQDVVHYCIATTRHLPDRAQSLRYRSTLLKVIDFNIDIRVQRKSFLQFVVQQVEATLYHLQALMSFFKLAQKFFDKHN